MGLSTNRADLLYRLPSEPLRFLRTLGRLADERGVPLYLVGGVVRDLILKRPMWDMDFTVAGDGMAFARAVADRYGAGLALFERFGTARLTMRDGRKIDIASARRERYAKPAALPDVERSSVQEDLLRRDFTINAMAIELNAGRFGRLLDPYGGRRDLKAGMLRVLHEKSFCDDPSRVFRAIRFEARFGFRMEPNTRRLLAQAAASNLVHRLSGPRLCNEVLLLLGERHPERVVAKLAKWHLLRVLHPRLRYAAGIGQLMVQLFSDIRWWTQARLPPDFDLRLTYLMALLCRCGPSMLRDVATRLQLSSQQSAAVRQAGRRTDRLADLLSRRDSLRASGVRRLLWGLPLEALLLTAAKSRIRNGVKGSVGCRERIVRYLKQDRSVTIRLGGKDLAALGLKPGPIYKRILERVLDAKVDGELPTAKSERDLAACLASRAVRSLRRLEGE